MNLVPVRASMNLSGHGARMGLFNRLKTSFRALFPRR
ncbi:conjugal transfer protein TraB, partial [Enterobacter hormaechei]|nr:conjugal transfer protein TraB [Enterobacter hormaechei]